MWYKEISNYDFALGKSSNGGVIGHFTQVVWKNSNATGFGLSASKHSGWYKYYGVAWYNPPGNYLGQYTANVLPLKV
jgi:hypothetical protein